ncbi:alpha/beta fold hydrolase [Rhodovulum sp. DZ06]|uniref:alpha/beta fold hydrolase n=1 Tax=Rhodovulum sp. DZ06 TaxID=3425126 RepID=UPI003D3457BA
MTENASLSRRTLMSTAGAAALAACAPADYARRAEARWPPEGDFTEAEGLRIHHLLRGPEGAPPAVLLHGATGNLRDFSFDLLDRVAAAGFRAVAFDRPGLGYSDRPAPEAEPWRPATQARILRAAAAKLGLAENAVVIGHSWGASVAMAWALQAPEATRGVVTIGGATMPWDKSEGLLDPILESAPATALKGALARAMIGLDGGEEVAERIFKPQAAPEGYIAHVGGPLILRPASFRANSQDIDRLHGALAEQAQGYAALDVPVRALHGAEDEITWPSIHATGMAALLPRGEARIVDGIGHMLHHARPDLVMDALAEVTAA